ncbi:hypothetical protein RclHR1_02820003 [Rhizophagus clarus]|nr:hypothetical protein RclHR1_02820003 [Rhizophagus clarus]
MLCLLLNAIQNDNQSFKFTEADLNDVIGSESVNVNVNIQIGSTNLKEPESSFGIIEWNSSSISNILKNVMEKLHTCFLNTPEEHEIMNIDAKKRPIWEVAFNDCFAFDEYQLMSQVLNFNPHPGFRFIHEEHTFFKSPYSIVTNARGIYLIVVVVIASSDRQREIKRQQGLIDAKQLKEQFRLANNNNEKVVCVLGAIIMNKTEMNKSTIIFVDEKDEIIARAVDENYLINQQVIGEIYLKVTRAVMESQDEFWRQDLNSLDCYDEMIDDYENFVVEESSEEMEKQDLNQQQKPVYNYIIIQLIILLFAIFYMYQKDFEIIYSNTIEIGSHL